MSGLDESKATTAHYARLIEHGMFLVSTSKIAAKHKVCTLYKPALLSLQAAFPGALYTTSNCAADCFCTAGRMYLHSTHVTDL